jgi:TPR repeat protein
MCACCACFLGIAGKCMLDDFMFYNFMDYRKALKWNHDKALKWYSENAERGNPHAQRMMGDITRESKDYKEALKWYNQAAEQGNWLAQGSLAFIYANDTFVPKDYVQAYKWAALSEQRFGGAEDLRNSLKEKMSAEQIAEAEKLIEEFEPETRKTTFKDMFYGLIADSLKEI